MQTEADIETAVSSKMDALDQQFLSTAMTQTAYNAAVRAIDKWAEEQRRQVKVARSSSRNYRALSRTVQARRKAVLVALLSEDGNG